MDRPCPSAADISGCQVTQHRPRGEHGFPRNTAMSPQVSTSTSTHFLHLHRSRFLYFSRVCGLHQNTAILAVVAGKDNFRNSTTAAGTYEGGRRMIAHHNRYVRSTSPTCKDHVSRVFAPSTTCRTARKGRGKHTFTAVDGETCKNGGEHQQRGDWAQPHLCTYMHTAWEEVLVTNATV